MEITLKAETLRASIKLKFNLVLSQIAIINIDTNNRKKNPFTCLSQNNDFISLLYIFTNNMNGRLAIIIPNIITISIDRLS